MRHLTTTHSNSLRNLESGDILLPLPTDVEAVRGLEEVQRFYTIVKPGRKSVFRPISNGRKRLRAAAQHERTWGLVDLVVTEKQSKSKSAKAA